MTSTGDCIGHHKLHNIYYSVLISTVTNVLNMACQVFKTGTVDLRTNLCVQTRSQSSEDVLEGATSFNGERLPFGDIFTDCGWIVSFGGKTCSLFFCRWISYHFGRYSEHCVKSAKKF